MIHAVVQARAFNQRGLANSPIFAGSLVNFTSGNTANESCRLRTTWLRMMSLAVPRSPYRPTVIRAGTMAKIGRASCRERVCVVGGAGALNEEREDGRKGRTGGL